MKFLRFPLIACISVLLSSECTEKIEFAKDTVPQDIQRFQKERDLCDHFRGEEGYDADRRKFLAEQVKTYCTNTDASLKTLKLKYKDNKTISDALNKYEERIE